MTNLERLDRINQLLADLQREVELLDKSITFEFISGNIPMELCCKPGSISVA